MIKGKPYENQILSDTLIPLANTFPTIRLRRLRKSQALRRLVRETDIHPQQFILPIFIKAGISQPVAVATMPGHFQWPLSHLLDYVSKIAQTLIGGILLFGIPDAKDALGSSASRADGIVQQAIRLIKSRYPDLLVIADLCFCEYTDHGHCGVLTEQELDNDATLPLLAEQALSLAVAGADVLAPSGMIDGMVGVIRQGLDRAGYHSTALLSYAVKYCSALYGPFRAAAEGTPRFGDRRSYQMDPANAGVALREVDGDVSEGADMLMVKPALSYLDVIYRVKQRYPGVPLAAYHVSGEYCMVKAAAANGWLSENEVMLEHLLSIRRAGAQIIINYAALEITPWLLKTYRG